ncbi:MAG TPA: ROK family transcriptional regulator [Microbacteriaceae bacterium]
MRFFRSEANYRGRHASSPGWWQMNWELSRLFSLSVAVGPESALAFHLEPLDAAGYRTVSGCNTMLCEEKLVGSPSALRKLNDRAALYALLESGPLSRLDLEQAIGVSRPAAAELLRRLEECGLARRAGYGPGGPGPRAQLWTINERAAFAAGLNVTELGIDAVLADLSGHPLGECKIMVGRGEDPTLTVKKLLSSMARSSGIRRSDLRQVMVGISGSVDPETGILNHAEHIPEWTGFDVQERLSRVAGMPVSVENDVKLVLSDELIRGRAVGCKDVLLLWMGAAIGIAMTAGGRLQHGFHGSAGELGLVPVGSSGRVAGDMLAANGVLELARAHGLKETDAPRMIEQSRSRQDADDDRFLSAFAGRIADVLVAPVAVIDPELILLAGDIGTAGGDELAERVRHRLHEMLAHRPRVAAGTGYYNSVRQGALDAALRLLREDIFEDARDHKEASA